VPATSFSGAEGQVLSVVIGGLSSALALCPPVAILSTPLADAMLRVYKMAPGLEHTKRCCKFWISKYSTLEGWFSSLAIPFHLVL